MRISEDDDFVPAEETTLNVVTKETVGTDNVTENSDISNATNASKTDVVKIVIDD